MFRYKNTEFTNLPNGDVEIRPMDKPVFTLAENHTHFIEALLDYVEEFYPECYNALCEEYMRFSANRIHYRFRMARRMLRCNFGELDSLMDIDHHASLNFEEVKCPRVGECKYHERICRPKFNTNLTSRELEVMEYLYNGYKAESIADILYISINTVETHKSNSLHKLSLHSLTDFIIYANRNKLFKK